MVYRPAHYEVCVKLFGDAQWGYYDDLADKVVPFAYPITSLEEGRSVTKALNVSSIDIAEFSRNAPLAVTGSSKFISGVPNITATSSVPCIPTAIGNLVGYWCTKGYSFATSPSSAALRAKNRFGQLEGGQANNNIPIVMSIFDYYQGIYAYYISATNVWNPAYSSIVSEINAGRPCLLGFAAGSIYSNEFGHMTVCSGYNNTSGMLVRLSDGGHHPAGFTTAFTYTYNDFISRMNVRSFMYSSLKETE